MQTRALFAAALPLVLGAVLAPRLVLAPEAPEMRPREGPLVVVGGGGTPAEVCARALELAGGRGARVVVLPHASRREDRGESTVRMWEEAGARVVANLGDASPAQAVREIDRADLVWISGGSQGRFMDEFRGGPVAEAILRARERGAVVGGTSAGAAVTSAAMITGEADLESIRAQTTELVPGLGLWPEAIVDQHFLARRRSNRLFAAVLDRPELLGIGIDERTAVIAHGAGFEVLGTGGVLVIDARGAEVLATEPGERAAATGIAVHLLRAGMRFEWGEDAARAKRER